MPDWVRRVGIFRALRRTVVVLAAGVRYVGPAMIKRNRAAIARGGCRACHALGSTYLKFGQLIASSPGIVGSDVADAFRSCLDTSPPIQQDEVFRSIETAAGRAVREAYLEVDERPLGLASIAVVHKARTAGGDEVAIKVLRPNVMDRAEVDILILRWLVTFAAKVGRSAGAAEAMDLVDDFDRNIRAEMNFTRERLALERVGERLQEHGFSRIAVPRAYEELSNDAVLAMEFFDGVPIDDEASIARLGVDAGLLVDDVIRAWLVTSLADGEFNGDCHAGNGLVLSDGRLGLIDWGIVGVLDARARHFVLRALEPAWERNRRGAISRRSSANCTVSPQRAGSVPAARIFRRSYAMCSSLSWSSRSEATAWPRSRPRTGPKPGERAETARTSRKARIGRATATRMSARSIKDSSYGSSSSSTSSAMPGYTIGRSRSITRPR